MTQSRYVDSESLCREPPSTGLMGWSDAVDYCPNTLGPVWRLPTITELRTLFRSATDEDCNSLEWNMSWDTVPTDYCGVWDGCLSYSACYQGSECFPKPCGPGCFWDAALSGECSKYWSASECADDTSLAWSVYFYYGLVDHYYKYYDSYVRCVRSGP